MTGQQAAAFGARVVWVTCALDGADHAVTDDRMAAGISSDTGLYEALCGARFAAAPMVYPPCPLCRTCLAFLGARATMRDLDHRMGAAARHRRSGLLGRLFRRRSQPPAVPPSSAPPQRDGRLPQIVYATSEIVSGAEVTDG